MKRVLLCLATLACTAAAPATTTQRGFMVAVPTGPALGPTAPSPSLSAPPGSQFQPAPTPNRELEAPLGGAATSQPSVSPTLINRKDTYRGEGFSRGSSPSEEQDKKVRPGAGFNLRMPLSPN